MCQSSLAQPSKSRDVQVLTGIRLSKFPDKAIVVVVQRIGGEDESNQEPVPGFISYETDQIV